MGNLAQHQVPSSKQHAGKLCKTAEPASQFKTYLLMSTHHESALMMEPMVCYKGSGRWFTKWDMAGRSWLQHILESNSPHYSLKM